MKTLILSLLLGLSFSAFAQEQYQPQMDSILHEADLLYRHEKATWISTDMILADRKLKKRYGGFVTYHSQDSTFVTILGKKQKSAIAKYTFIGTEFDQALTVDMEYSVLSELEKKLLHVKSKLLKKVFKKKYEVVIPKGFDPNFILLKTASGYRFYIIMGTTQEGSVPFGNDYIFEVNTDLEITQWQKLHSRIIPAPPNFPGMGTVTSVMHSHLKSTPYITATDICTFRLYAKYTDLKEFSVYSPKIGYTMKYILESNEIVLEE